MFHYIVNRQFVICFDFVVTMTTQRNFFKVSDLLVVKKIKELSKLTSDPMRVKTLLENHMGTQNYHQHELGKMWFMKSLLRRNIFPLLRRHYMVSSGQKLVVLIPRLLDNAGAL